MSVRITTIQEARDIVDVMTKFNTLLKLCDNPKVITTIIDELDNAEKLIKDKPAILKAKADADTVFKFNAEANKKLEEHKADFHKKNEKLTQSLKDLAAQQDQVASLVKANTEVKAALDVKAKELSNVKANLDARQVELDKQTAITIEKNAELTRTTNDLKDKLAKLSTI